VRVDSLLQQVANELGLRVVMPLAGGEFGATLVVDDQGRELVLKALPSPEWAPLFARGVELAECVRSTGYPAPRYAGTGVVLDATWSLQERLPGEVPDVLSGAHATRLTELCERHADLAPRRSDWLSRVLPEMTANIEAITGRSDTSSLAQEMAAVIERCRSVRLRDGDIAHGDFHHRNFLAVRDDITGVFDWEFASIGDWRIDLANIAAWSLLAPWQVPPDVAAVFGGRAAEVCETDVLALLVAHHVVRLVEFNSRVHPDWLAGILERLEMSVAPWWRAVL
jgi:thiamine kinase-like enzyme